MTILLKNYYIVVRDYCSPSFYNSFQSHLVEHHSFPWFGPPKFQRAQPLYDWPLKLNGNEQTLPCAGPETVRQRLLGQTFSVQVATPEEVQIQVLQSFVHVEPGVQLGEVNSPLEVEGQGEG